MNTLSTLSGLHPDAHDRTNRKNRGYLKRVQIDETKVSISSSRFDAFLESIILTDVRRFPHKVNDIADYGDIHLFVTDLSRRIVACDL